MLPCSHPNRIVEQVQPTVHLLSNLDKLHPEVLLQHGIQPPDYKGGLVFRSAIESIRGTFIASSTTGREAFVATVLHVLQDNGSIVEYQHTSSQYRHDFEIVLSRNPDYFVALEVKGGEGNSINISQRPTWAKEFGVWSHLDGAIVNQPARSARSVINRLTNELVSRSKIVDVLIFKDSLCGTVARPCPKFPGHESSIGLLGAPDIFLFPVRVPSPIDPDPPVHTRETLRLPDLILNAFDIREAQRDAHLWQVQVRLIVLDDGRYQREVSVLHQGEIVDTSRSRPWREG
jgi:hypothetical protein